MSNDPALTVPTAQSIITDALIDAGIVGLEESIEPPVLNRSLTQANYLLTQWQRKRFMVYHLVTYNVTSTGAQTYNVGAGQSFNINPRPERLESAYLRLLNNSGVLTVDLPLNIVPSMEDYNRFTLKNMGTLAWQIFYDPAWPVGVLYPWPVPQASLYGIFVTFKETLNQFVSLDSKVNLPLEYRPALQYCLARRFRATYQLPPDPGIDRLAREAVNAIRLANAAVPTLVMPSALRSRQRAYDYRSDNP